MRIAVMGSGGLGGYFGARLAKGGQADVHFIARGKHLEAMRAEGLRVEGPEPLYLPRVNVTDDPRHVGVVDLVMFCVKLWDTDAALAQIRPMVGKDTVVISFQNGVLKDDYLRAAFDPAQIMGGVVGRAQVLVLQNAVLERDDRRAGPDQGADLLQRRLGVPQLDAEHHEIDDADLGRIVGRADAGDVKGLRPFDAQAFAAHRLQVLAAGDEVHVRAARGEARTEVAAQPAGTHHCDSHGLASVKLGAYGRTTGACLMVAPSGGRARARTDHLFP